MSMSRRNVLCVVVALLMISGMLGVSFIMPPHEVQATAPPLCRVLRTDNPHRSLDERGNYVVRVHATTNCTNIPGVAFVWMLTQLYLDGSWVNGDYKSGVQFAQTTDDGPCQSGMRSAYTIHKVTYNWVEYSFQSGDYSRQFYVQCPP